MKKRGGEMSGRLFLENNVGNSTLNYKESDVTSKLRTLAKYTRKPCCRKETARCHTCIDDLEHFFLE